jgi:hypothetical protein
MSRGRSGPPEAWRAGVSARGAFRLLSQPLVGLRGTPGTAGPADQGGRWLPPIPYGVSTPIGSRPVGPSQAASREGGPPCAFVPLQRQSPEPRTVSILGTTRPKSSRRTRPTMLPLLDFRALRHIPASRIRVVVADPSATACRVRGLGTPFATYTARPADAEASERPWASPFKAFSSTRWVPLSGPVPS